MSKIQGESGEKEKKRKEKKKKREKGKKKKKKKKEKEFGLSRSHRRDFLREAYLREGLVWSGDIE